MTIAPCVLCAEPGGELIWRDQRARIVWIHDAQHPAYMRVIWNQHVKEMSDLSLPDRAYLMDLVFRLEQVLRATLQPAKVNLASLGNMVPHLHWHVIPRFTDDPHFPQSSFGEALRDSIHRIENPDAFKRALIEEFK
jgi:diadenosine tetraphosphate (Ap4A) HIT family hydrolase